MSTTFSNSEAKAVYHDGVCVAWFDDFFREQFGPVVRFLIRAGAAPAEAEDAAQSAMEALLVHHESVRDAAAWVRVVARNNWLRALQRSPLAAQPEAADTQMESCEATGADPAKIVQSRMQRELITELLNQLPSVQRRVVALIADGYNSEEIASLLGSSPAVVRSNLSHARRRLRRDRAA